RDRGSRSDPRGWRAERDRRDRDRPAGRVVCRREQGAHRGRAQARGSLMDIDMAALRALEHEKDLSFDVVVGAIEQALLVAYQRTEGAKAHARVELNRKSGHVVVWVREPVEG